MSVETGVMKSWNNEGVITARTPRLSNPSLVHPNAQLLQMLL